MAHLFGTSRCLSRHLATVSPIYPPFLTFCWAQLHSWLAFSAPQHPRRYRPQSLQRWRLVLTMASDARPSGCLTLSLGPPSSQIDAFAFCGVSQRSVRRHHALPRVSLARTTPSYIQGPWLALAFTHLAPPSSPQSGRKSLHSPWHIFCLCCPTALTLASTLAAPPSTLASTIYPRLQS